VTLALAFGGYVWYRHGSELGLQYLTGYVIEKSLSVDNIFVFVVIFGALGIPPIYQHRVLFWGILSALLMRGAMIAPGPPCSSASTGSSTSSAPSWCSPA